MEIMVAMAIVGIIFAAAATGLRSAFNVNLKSSAGKLASTLRYLSNKAVTEHRYIRVIFDLQAQSYSVEECTDPIVVSVEEEEDQFKEDEKKKDEPQPADEEGDKEEGGDGEAGKKAESSCVPSESSLLKPVKLPNDVFFKDVSLSYLQAKKEQGKASTYFFPDGYATPTIVNLKDEEDENHYAVEVEALSGKVRVTGDYQEHFSGWGKDDEK